MGRCIAAVALLVVSAGAAHADVLGLFSEDPAPPAVQPVVAAAPPAPSIVPVTLTALELDSYYHDTFTRHGDAAFLGVEDGAAVLLCSRYVVDMTFRETERGDFASPNDWGAHRLSILGDRYLLAPVSQQDPTPAPSIAYYRIVGDNADRALVYVPIVDGSPFAGGLASLGIEHPTAFVVD